MTDRLSPLDVSFLYMETPTTAMHVGGLATFEPPQEGFDYDRLVDLISERIALVPRYRQKVRWIPGRLANPVWVDDEDFDVTYHVRRSALPRPGTDAQLRELVGRLMGRRLDRSRPLWEIYLVEGLDGRPGRRRHQDPPRHGRRRRRGRHRHGDPGRHTGAARGAGGRLAARAAAGPG